MKYSYDFHIHSALSPCAEDEMTPNNIVNMAVINGLDIIAVTDHNSVANLTAIAECAEGKPLVFIPGIEVEAAEEVHISCLFADVDAAIDMGRLVRKHLRPVANNERVLGMQYIFDAKDNVIAKEGQMLLFSTGLTSREIFAAAEALGGYAYFSHVDRASYSVLSVLGDFPDDMDICVAEMSNSAKECSDSEKSSYTENMTVLYCSDAHRLADISRGENFIELPIEQAELTAQDVIEWLKSRDRG